MSALHQSCNRSNHGSRRAGRIRARREIGFPSPPQAGCPKLRCSLTRIVVSKYTKEELAGERQDVGFEPPEGGQPDLAGRWCSTASGAAAPPYRSCQPLRAFAFSASPRSNVSDSLRRPSHDDFEGIGRFRFTTPLARAHARSGVADFGFESQSPLNQFTNADLRFTIFRWSLLTSAATK